MSRILDWQPYAKCLDVSEAIHMAYADSQDPEELDDCSAIEFIEKFCNKCPVRDLCLKYAQEQGEQFGVWGGKTAKERRELG